MKRTLILLSTVALLLCCSLSVFAQIPNASFENWTAGNPDGWWTNNLASASWVPVTQSRTAHSGTFSLRGDVIAIVTGAPYSPQIASGADMTGFPWTQRSASITGYYQFYPASGSGDRISTLSGLGKNSAGGSTIAVGGGYISTAASSWTQFSVPFTYLTNDVPGWASFTLVIIGPGSASPKVGSYYLIDDLAFSGTASAVSDPAGIPESFTLEQNYPNPFNPSTNISFSIPQSGFVSLKIYDVLGSEVTSLVEEQKSAGTYHLTWNAAGLPSGVYLYKIVVSSDKGQTYSAAKRLVLVK